ncbi:glycosyltransferase [Macrococcus brunensis]|uniref:Glycosyltransferase n=1 Tax=Macrococcus brunensis TaxID=198483 RepID=A0A4R6BAM5_9STAP|nr:glycosyltransferase family 4 protein [Macrococcus brunensis]TDL93358.1 glycosyltransferase [Macrococcus brunensis]
MKYLLVANAYPNKDRIYSNTFLHRRVKSYQQKGLEVEVVVMSTKVIHDEIFDGVTVKYMDEYQLTDYVNTCPEIKTILIHFMNQKMFTAVSQIEREVNYIIWLHGFEAEPWYSRYYNYTVSKKALSDQLAKIDYYEKQRNMFQTLYKMDNVTFIFVSESFKKYYVDPFVRQAPPRYYIIPNLIDEKLFPYREKKEADRFKVCNIRPYTAPNYANDITRDVILKLSKKKYFKKMEFSLYGDGPLFKEMTEPLEKFENVQLYQGFVRQDDISDIHAHNGIYLGPSRHDSQGVSLCEAMSSGLVPISNDIGAIAEFVEHGRSGFLAGRDQVDEMVFYIEKLINNPELFMQMSVYASDMIIKKTGTENVIKKELEVMIHD